MCMCVCKIIIKTRAIGPQRFDVDTKRQTLILPQKKKKKKVNKNKNTKMHSR